MMITSWVCLIIQVTIRLSNAQNLTDLVRQAVEEAVLETPEVDVANVNRGWSMCMLIF